MRRTIKIGDAGVDVKVWQAVVNVEADGSFGPITEQQTKIWQLENDLKDDGVVGPITWGRAAKNLQNVINVLEGNI